MPELPEAEIARRQLERWLGEGPITRFHLEDRAVVRTHPSSRPSDAVSDPDTVLAGLMGARPRGTWRHGKRIGLQVGEQGILVHLGMSGKLVRSQEGPPRFARLGFETPMNTVWLCDQRRFGCVCVMDVELLDGALRQGHGPDALLEAPSGKELRERLRGRRAVKVALLDQAVLAGVGNIHAVEALFRAQIDPHLRCDQLSEAQCERLAVELPAHLAEVIVAEDAGEIVYITEGKRDNPFAIYGRDKQACKVCFGEILKSRQSGRSTFWCPSCQAG